MTDKYNKNNNKIIKTDNNKRHNKKERAFLWFSKRKNINRSERKKLNSFKWRQRYDPDSFLDRPSYTITTFLSDTRQPEVEFLHSWAVILNENLGKLIFSKRVKTLSKTNLIASRHIKIEKGSLPVDVHSCKTLYNQFELLQ